MASPNRMAVKQLILGEVNDEWFFLFEVFGGCGLQPIEMIRVLLKPELLLEAGVLLNHFVQVIQNLLLRLMTIPHILSEG